LIGPLETLNKDFSATYKRERDALKAGSRR